MFRDLEHCLEVSDVEIVSVGLLVCAFVSKRPDQRLLVTDAGKSRQCDTAVHFPRGTQVQKMSYRAPQVPRQCEAAVTVDSVGPPVLTDLSSCLNQENVSSDTPFHFRGAFSRPSLNACPVRCRLPVIDPLCQSLMTAIFRSQSAETAIEQSLSRMPLSSAQQSRCLPPARIS